MQKSKKLAAFGLVLALIIGYAFGKYSTPTKVEIKKEIQTVEKKVLDVDKLREIESEMNKKLRTIIVEIKRPDGTVEKTTRQILVTTTSKNTKEDTSIKEKTETEVTQKESTLIENKKLGVSISAMIGLDATKLSTPQTPIYGGQLQKTLLGPISIGAFGLSNGVCGTSIGLIF